MYSVHSCIGLPVRPLYNLHVPFAVQDIGLGMSHHADCGISSLILVSELMCLELLRTCLREENYADAIFIY